MVEKLILYLFVVLTLVYSNGCKDSGIDIKNLQLVNTSWRLESFETIGVYITPIQDGRVYSITFLPDSVAQVRADCNDCVATYETSVRGTDPQIAVRVLYCTEKYCGPESLYW